MIEDVQNREDERNIQIDRVGVSGLRYPIVVLDRHHERQQTVAEVTMSVALPAHFKGTHMSRFVEILNDHRGEMTLRTMPQLLEAIREKLEAESAHVEVAFPYFIERSAPASGAKALCDYQCAFVGEMSPEGGTFTLRATIPVTSLCPCSKAISDYGAHNQRGFITVEVSHDRVETQELVWIEELVEIAESSASAPVYALLKRADERHVTMQAFENPVFVEDMVRGVAQRLRAESRVQGYRVHAENHESIHNHSAFAEIVS